MEFAILVVSCLTLMFSFASGFTALCIWINWLGKNNKKEKVKAIENKIKSLKNMIANSTSEDVKSYILLDIQELQNELVSLNSKTNNPS